MPPVRVARTGTPQAIASSAARPKDSLSLGRRKRSAAARRGSISARSPRKATFPATPRRRASSSALGRSGPSPTRTSRAGRRSFTFAKTRTTSMRRFTGRKLETCISTASPGSARRSWKPAVQPGRKRSRSTKFGMRRMARFGLKTLIVSSTSHWETAVTPSLLSMAWRVVRR